jgi:hypothetical protein
LPAADAAEMREIIAAWSRRQNAVRSLVVRWTESRSRTAPQSRFDDDTRRDRSSYTRKSILKLDGRKAEWICDVPDTLGGRLLPHWRAIFDGRSSISFHRNEDGRHSGTIVADPYYTIGNDATMAGLLPVYRGMEPACAKLDIHKAAIKGTAPLDGRECVIVGGPKEGSIANELWLDPALEYAPRRWLNTVDDQPCLKLDITYASDAVDGLLKVASYSLRHTYEDGTLGLTVEAVVDDIQFNVPIDESSFVVAFPPGTSVLDKVANRDYIVPGGGEVLQRLAADEEASGWSIWIWGLAAAAVIAVAAVAVRMRMKAS